MSDREIMNSKQGLPTWWKPNLSFLKEEWRTHSYLKRFSNVSCITKDVCKCKSSKLVELWEHDSVTVGRIDTKVCIECNKVKSFKIVR